MAFSDDIRDYIDDMDSQWEKRASPEERKSREFVGLIVEAIVLSRQHLAGQAGTDLVEKLERLAQAEPEVLQHLVDERFTRELLDVIPGYTTRIMKLSALKSASTTSHITDLYLSEAVRTYVFGLALASVALCRAALEQALKEGTGYQGTRTFVEMNKLLDEAESAGIIDGTVRRMARGIADKADDVLHEKPASLEDAFEVLVTLRGVLQHLYAE